MADHTGHVIESQVDWLTASAYGTERAHGLAWLASEWAKEEKAKGNRTRKWRLMGYEGTHCGAVEWGMRDDSSCIIRLIGDGASRHLREVTPLVDRVTRLDLAVTWRAEPPDPYLGRNSYALADLHHRKYPRSSAPWAVQDSNGGFTCYLGNRTSESFFRIYNKEEECRAKDDAEGLKRYQGCWRYELETKGSLPAPLAELLTQQEHPEEYVQRYVYEWARSHGLEPPFADRGGVQLVPGFRRRSDADSKLKHLSRNVRPTIDFLRDAGFLDEALVSLGLSKSASQVSLTGSPDDTPD